MLVNRLYLSLNIQILLCGLVLNMDYNFGLFWQQPAINKLATVFPSRKLQKSKGTQFFLHSLLVQQIKALELGLIVSLGMMTTTNTRFTSDDIAF